MNSKTFGQMLTEDPNAALDILIKVALGVDGWDNLNKNDDYLRGLNDGMKIVNAHFIMLNKCGFNQQSYDESEK